MKKNNKKNLRRNIVIGVILAICGLTMVILTQFLYDFRIGGGYSYLDANCFLTAIDASFILILEWVTPLAGIFMIFIGILAVKNNYKKMR